jgi:hypothetical protein
MENINYEISDHILTLQSNINYMIPNLYSNLASIIIRNLSQIDTIDNLHDFQPLFEFYPNQH